MVLGRAERQNGFVVATVLDGVPGKPVEPDIVHDRETLPPALV